MFLRLPGFELKGVPGPSGEAKNVKVFFRLWITQTADTNYVAATYPSKVDATGQPTFPEPAPGQTLPFSAAPDLSDYNASPEINNRTITIPAAKQDVWAYFGCYLNIYDPPISLPGSHHCLVAEIACRGAPIIDNSGNLTPENCSLLAQRNIQITPSDNPGSPTTRVPQTFDTRPSRVVTLRRGDLASYPDELVIDWGNTPVGTEASIYWPGVDASEVLQLASALYTTRLLAASDNHTIQCQVPRGLTYVPIPSSVGQNFAGLFTLELPQSVFAGQEFNLSVRRINTQGVRRRPITTQSRTAAVNAAPAQNSGSSWRYVVGSFGIQRFQSPRRTLSSLGRKTCSRS